MEMKEKKGRGVFIIFQRSPSRVLWTDVQGATSAVHIVTPLIILGTVEIGKCFSYSINTSKRVFSTIKLLNIAPVAFNKESYFPIHVFSVQNIENIFQCVLST